MKKDGFEETPLTTGFYDDRWYTKPAPLFLPKGHYWLHELDGLKPSGLAVDSPEGV